MPIFQSRNRHKGAIAILVATTYSLAIGTLFHGAPVYAAKLPLAQQWDKEGAVLGGDLPRSTPPPVVTDQETPTEKSWFSWWGDDTDTSSSDDDKGEPEIAETSPSVAPGQITTSSLPASPRNDSAAMPPSSIEAGLDENTDADAPRPAGQMLSGASRDNEPALDIGAPSQEADISAPPDAIDVVVEEPDLPVDTEPPVETASPFAADTVMSNASGKGDMQQAKTSDRADTLNAAQSLADENTLTETMGAAIADQAAPVENVTEAIKAAGADTAQADAIIWSAAGVPAPPPAPRRPKPPMPPDLSRMQAATFEAIAQAPPPSATTATIVETARDTVDATSADGGTLPLRQALEEGLRISPDVKSTSAARDVLEATLRDITGQQSPQISAFTNVSGSYDTSQQESTRFDDSIYANAGLRMNWQLYTFGAAAARTTAGAENVVRGEQDLADRAETTAFEIITSYLEVMRQNEMLAVEAFRLEQHETFLKLIEEAAAAEQVLRSQLLLARTGLDQKKQAYMNVERTLKQALFALERLLDRTVDPVALARPFTPLVILPEEGEFIARTIDSAPEVLALQAAVAAQRNELKATRRDRFGNINLNMSASADRNILDSDEGGETTADAALEYSVPLYTGGSLQARVDRAKGAMRQAEADLQKARMTLREQLRLAYFAVQQNESILQSAQREEEIALQTLEAYRGEVAYGGRSFSDVVTQIDSVASARGRAISARYAKMLAAFAIIRRQNGLLDYFQLPQAALHGAQKDG